MFCQDIIWRLLLGIRRTMHRQDCDAAVIHDARVGHAVTIADGYKRQYKHHSCTFFPMLIPIQVTKCFILV